MIFRLDRDGNNFSVLHNFEGGNFFWYRSLVQDSAGVLYGTNVFNPSNVFRIEADGSNYSVLHTFVNPGEGQMTSLMLASDGFLYGTTASDASSVFRLDRNGGNFETIHAFTDVAEEGEHPMAPLIEGTDGFLYGTTFAGGQYSFGTTFKLRKDGSAFEVIHDFFESINFPFPPFALTQVAGGSVYGTRPGENGSGGRVFRMTTSGQHFDVVHDFESATGDDPKGALIQGLDGALYGTTRSGGTGDKGVVYRLSIPLIAAISPSSGPAGGGTLVTISGSGFQTGAAVTIGGSLAGAVVGPGRDFGQLAPVARGHPERRPRDQSRWDARPVRRGLARRLPGCPAVEPVSRLRRADRAPRDHVGLRRRQLLRRRLRHASPNGRLPAEGQARPRLRAASLRGRLSGRRLPLALRRLDRTARGRKHHRRLRGRQLLPRQLRDARPDGGFPAEDRARLFLRTARLHRDLRRCGLPSPFANWIERLAAEGVTGGCGGGNYCPANPNTRGQMAVFLAKTFGLVP